MVGWGFERLSWGSVCLAGPMDRREYCVSRTHHAVDRAGLDERLGDVQGLLPIVGLRDVQVVHVHAQALGVPGVQGVLGVDEDAGAAWCRDSSMEGRLEVEGAGGELGLYTLRRGATAGATDVPIFWASAMTWRATVVFPELSGPYISTTRPRGSPPVPGIGWLVCWIVGRLKDAR